MNAGLISGLLAFVCDDWSSPVPTWQPVEDIKYICFSSSVSGGHRSFARAVVEGPLLGAVDVAVKETSR